MDKNGNLTAGRSPCEVCGRPSVLVKDGQAVCEQHNVENKPREFTLPQGANKVASVLSTPNSNES